MCPTPPLPAALSPSRTTTSAEQPSDEQPDRPASHATNPDSHNHVQTSAETDSQKQTDDEQRPTSTNEEAATAENVVVGTEPVSENHEHEQHDDSDGFDTADESEPEELIMKLVSRDEVYDAMGGWWLYSLFNHQYTN